MDKSLPLFLSFSILIGLLGFVISIQVLVREVISFSAPDKIHGPYNSIILEKVEKRDTLAVRTISQLEPGASTKGKKLDAIKKRYYLNLNPAVLSWIVFNSIGIALAWASSLFISMLIYQIVRQYGINVFGKESINVTIPFLFLLIITLSLLIFINDNKLIINGGADIMAEFGIIFQNPSKATQYVIRCYMPAGLVAITGILMINLAIYHNFNNKEKRPANNLANTYKHLKGNLNIFALFAGLLVAISVIGTRLLRNMIGEQLAGVKTIFPDEFIFAYGASFTLILALFFVPTQLYLKYYKYKEHLKLPVQNEMVSWWKIGQESIDDFKLAFSIILPLLSSIVQAFIST